jgi:site-specific recombinase XerD
MERIPPPVARRDQLKPFTQTEIDRLLDAARRSCNPKRNEAIICLLYDTGIRASELCALRRKDVDLGTYRCTVLGKGNKLRTVSFARTTLKTFTAYLGDLPKQPDEPLFTSDRGKWAGDPLTRWGLLQLIERLGKAAGVQGTRCSPHTFRHSFAVQFLRNGGNVFTLREMLGHTQLDIVNIYVNLAEADVENQPRQFSPMESLRRRRQ